MLLVVDALADFGRSGGVGGAASSLDVTMRAASALAEHFVRNGDRVALRVVSGQGGQVGSGAGRRHLRRILGQLAVVRPARLRDDEGGRLRLRTTGGTVVIVLSPLLSEVMGTATATLQRRGLPVLVVDTLPEHVGALGGGGHRPAGGRPGVADAAYRARAVPHRVGPRGLPGRGVAGPGDPRRRAAPAGPASAAAPGAGPMTFGWREWTRGQWLLRAVVAARAARRPRWRAGRATRRRCG